MPIKDLYTSVQKDKQSQPGKPKMFTMPLMEYLAEHKELLRVLKSGSKQELMTEATDQEKELNQCLKDHGMTMADIDESADMDDVK